MAFFDNLRAAIAAVVRPNGRRAITGANLQATLFTMIDGMGQGMQYLGIATPDTIPGTPDFPAYYLAGFNADDTHGDWTPEAFGMDQEVAPGAILRWTGREWVEVTNPLGRLQDVYVYELDTAIRAKYTKPASGIPYSDMSAAVQSALDAGARAEEGVTDLRTLVPTQASEQNQLADKNFVNSSIQTATATFRGIMDCWCALGALGSEPDNNDYAVLKRCNDYIYEFNDDPDEPHYTGDIFGYDGAVYRVVTDFLGSFDETKCEKIGELALYGGEPDGVGGVQRYYSYSIEGKTYFRIADWDVDNPDGLSPSDPGWIPANWVLIEGTYWGVDTPLATWRWKYSGPSGSGVYAWKAEYQINDTPLTAAQLAALNSNITEALTNKLVALPAKPVDTAAQTLTDAEKAQARTNIGATAPEVFWATYGTTTASEIDAAAAAGKAILCMYNGTLYTITSLNANNIYFGSSLVASNKWLRLAVSTGIWYSGTEDLQGTSGRVTSWQHTPDNTHYPAEKLVKDSLDAKQPLIDSSHKLDYSLLDNTPTIPAAQVQSDWNQSDNTQADFIKNKPTIPAAQVQSDWNEADANSKAFIQNKPTIPSAPVTMQGATASTEGSAGYAPAPAAGDNTKFLKGDGTWQNVSVPQEIMNLIYAGL